MTEESRPQPSNQPLNVRTLAAGTRLRLVNEATVEVVDNPQDGMWLLCRILESPDDPGLEGTEDSIFVQDVAEVLG